ncbi:class II histone deacetylase [Paroceanicella profunda]|uniref:Class II histone deacetylase n=1 Tax=Paroceanicella profunda TaxID=2579971 RepID=A0A5B8G241_9RHOB|nr:class II histone deacetylase [Paroceanicella profunda]QDL93349.1 class II histone deacetylase [Paroceanicella profunda]
MATGFNFHELYLWHDTKNYASVFPPGLTIEPGEHAENPTTKRRMRNLLEVSGLLGQLTALPATPVTQEDILRVHTPAYVAKLRALSEAEGGDAGGLTPFGTGSFEIARLAAGGTCRVLEAVLRGEVANGYALTRPPGHHAERDIGMGFCLLGNIPIAILKARAEHGLGRVAVVDWDVHHGNGTEQAFWEDGETLTISLHQDRLFPLTTGGTGSRGAGAGLGANINIPLPPGSGHGAYVAAFERLVLPALEAFGPEMVVVASGFDGSANDPLGCMMMHSGTYRALTRMLMDFTACRCGGRLAMNHEGGYSASHVPYCGLAVLEEMSGIATGIEDPWLSNMAAYGQQELQPHQAAAIAAAAEGQPLLA